MFDELLNDAIDYIQLSLKTYVQATKMVDKFFATRLVVAACAIATDYLLTAAGGTITQALTIGKVNLEDDDAITIYRDRINDLELFEKQLEMELSLNKRDEIMKLKKTFTLVVDVLVSLHVKNPLPVLLSLNFKELQNLGIYYVLETRRFVRNYRISQYTSS